MHSPYRAGHLVKHGAAAEYCDTISGAKFTRTGLDRLMAAVRKRKIDVILCVKLDLLGRSFPSGADDLRIRLQRRRAHLHFPAYRHEQGEPRRTVIMHVLIAMAEFERSLIKERTRAGLRVAKAGGVKFGRPVNSVTQKCREIVQAFREGNIRTYRRVGQSTRLLGQQSSCVSESLKRFQLSRKKLCLPRRQKGQVSLWFCVAGHSKCTTEDRNRGLKMYHD